MSHFRQCSISIPSRINAAGETSGRTVTCSMTVNSRPAKGSFQPGTSEAASSFACQFPASADSSCPCLNIPGGHHTRIIHSSRHLRLSKKFAAFITNRKRSNHYIRLVTGFTLSAHFPDRQKGCGSRAAGSQRGQHCCHIYRIKCPCHDFPPFKSNQRRQPGHTGDS